jgi:hypothetical protein
MDAIKENTMSRMEKLLKAVKSAQSNGAGERNDKVFYYPQRDQAGNGSAIIRFLPGKTDDDIPFVKLYSHFFKGPTGKWYAEDCPTTIGQPCYCCEQNGILWNTNIKANQDTVRERKRKVTYISNILVIADPKNPENEGKVFLFKFGQKIFDKIVDKLQPVVDDLDPQMPVDVFDLKEGLDFMLKIRKVEGQTNYEKSEFKKEKSAVTVDLSTIEDLGQFTNESRFKSHEELQKSFERAVGNTVRLNTKSSQYDNELHVETKVQEPKTSSKTESTSSSDDDDIAAMMAKLAKDDKSLDDDIPF